MRQFASCVRVGILLGLAIGWSVASARADPVLIDQVNVGTRVGGIGIFQGTEIAQTLTVGTSGVLTQLDLGVFNPNPGSMTFPDPLSIQVQRTSGGLPTGTAVQSITVPIGNVTTDRFALTSFGGWNVDVQAGEVLAIVLTTANGNYGWSTACCYSGGDMFVSRGSGFTPIFPNTSGVPADFMFRTFVDPSLSTTATPEPQGLLLLASGLMVALIARFRRQILADDR